MMLHESKVDCVIVFYILMSECYAKKDARPSITISLSTPVFGFFTVIVWESFGIVSKNF